MRKEPQSREPKNKKTIIKRRYHTKRNKLDKCNNRAEKLFVLSSMLVQEEADAN